MNKIVQQGFLLLIGVFLLGSITTGVFAQVPERPYDSTVVDDSYYLSPSTIEQIDLENKTWSQTKEQLQIGVLVLDSLYGQDLESLANETFRKWQIGYAGTNNGVLLLIAIEDRAFRLETSDNAATVLTDIEARQILDNSREFFRAEDYDNGVLYIVDAIGDRFYGTDRSDQRLEEFYQESGSDSGYIEILIFVVIIIVFIMMSKSGGGRGGPGGGGDLLWWLLTSSGGSHSSSRGSSSSHSGSFGGGGWSGGGGGGGGASSGW